MTGVDEEELKRREKYLRADLQPFSWIDPFTWSRAPKNAFFSGLGTTAIIYQLLNWRKKPLYYSFFPNIAVVASIAGLGYLVGKHRENLQQTRDAVIEHYISLHPGDFDRVQNYFGRPYSQLFLPWYPRRSDYRPID